MLFSFHQPNKETKELELDLRSKPIFHFHFPNKGFGIRMRIPNPIFKNWNHYNPILPIFPRASLQFSIE